MTYYLTVFGRQIPIYGLLFYGGILAAAIVGILLAKKRDLPKYDIVYYTIKYTDDTAAESYTLVLTCEDAARINVNGKT